MVPYGRTDDATVEEDFGRVGDAVKHAEGFLKLLVVIMDQRLHPCLDFLSSVSIPCQ